MFKWILSKTIGTKNEREIKRLRPLVKKINQIEEEYQKLSDEELKAKTNEFKERLEKGETVDDIMPEVFAVVKNACKRLLGSTWDVCGHTIKWDMVPFDVQIMGAIVLHQRKIAEMATGEGKTLVATMPLYLNALTGNNVQLVTVNDYLARRDSEWMSGIYKFLGLTVGCLQNNMDNNARREAYQYDITYGTNSEFGFDYLRDNSMSFSKEDQVQRGHYYAIIDEVDSILIDEARTPLIISGPSTVSTNVYKQIKPRVHALVKKQMLLCSSLLSKARELLKEGQDKEHEAGIKFYQVKWGMPKQRQFLKTMEDPRIRRLVDKTEVYLLSDMNREERAAVKEELFFVIEEKNNEIELTEKGRDSLNPANPDEFILPDIITIHQEIDEDKTLTPREKERKKRTQQANYEKTANKIHNMNQLLRAYTLFEKDVAYVVKDNKVMIVDEFTGRIMPGRRYSDGLHQALEAKEDVKVERETQTLASITIQNYFRMYEKLAGMTGTAETEANEFWKIYKLDVIVVPTNRPVQRKDYNDVIYKTRREKYNAIIDEVAQLHKEGRPVLLGTVSVDTSELLSRLLKRKGIAHAVLNAKYHQKEAEIIANAGVSGSVTIATNMAGRGTDIKLSPGVPELGGLHVIGSERHEARRIDRQLRGRCARQGDLGSSRFYVSLEDDLMRLFGSDRIAGIMTRLGIQEGQELSHPLLTHSIERAQKRVEQRNFSIRKHTLDYDDVMNKQRQSIYEFRNEIISTDRPMELLFSIIEEVLDERIKQYIEAEEQNIQGMVNWVNSVLLVSMPEADEQLSLWNRDQWKTGIMNLVKEAYKLKEEYETPEAMQRLLKMIMLGVVDRLWKEHLYAMDGLRESIGFRAYGQQDPLVEYKREGYQMFAEMMGHINEDITSSIFSSSFSQDNLQQYLTTVNPQFLHRVFGAGSFEGTSELMPQSSEKSAVLEPAQNKQPNQRPAGTYHRTGKKIGRNDPCPCGSGKKYKYCCGRNK